MDPWPTYNQRPKASVRQQIVALAIVLGIGAIIVVFSIWLIDSADPTFGNEGAQLRGIQSAEDLAAVQRSIREGEQWGEQHQSLYAFLGIAFVASIVAGVFWMLSKMFTAAGDTLDAQGVWDRKIARRPARKPELESFRRGRSHSHRASDA
jgi:hypothetical protein